MSSMSRTMRLIEGWGWTEHWVVERFIQGHGHKVDFFHIIDLIALTPKGCVGIQVCSDDFAPHVKKMLEDEIVNTTLWLKTPKTRLFLIGWRKMRMKGTTKRWKYYPRVAQFKLKKGVVKMKEFSLSK